jgi:hypothetical protein
MRAADSHRADSTYERDDPTDLIVDTPAIGFLPRASSAPPAIAGLLRSRA